MKQILFTVGPVEMHPETLELGGTQLPYFRTPEFSALALENERILLTLADAPQGSRAIFLTASGTGAMEAALINGLAEGDRALIVVGGSFGQRFVEICEDDGIANDTIEVAPGRALDLDRVKALDLSRYKALLVNAHETSTGVLYDILRLGEICRASGLLFIVDAVSAFLCDALSMQAMGIDILITSSQKALALPPGLSMLVLSPAALVNVKAVKPRSHYLGLAKYLLDGERGQTPFTPAVGIILQLNGRLKAIANAGGAAVMVARAAGLASHFRHAIQGLPFTTFAETPSNALTALSPRSGVSAYDVFMRLKEDYGLIVTPNGGALRDRVFRVGHMGNLTEENLDALAEALGRLWT